MEERIRELKKEYETLLKSQVEKTKTVMFVSFARLFTFSVKGFWRDTQI
jgi:hypothetical protein